MINKDNTLMKNVVFMYIAINGGITDTKGNNQRNVIITIKSLFS